MYRKYLYSIPVMSLNVDRTGQEATLSELRRGGAGRVFLAVGGVTDANLDTYCASLKRNISFFRNSGLETGVWMCSCGHGGPLVDEAGLPDEHYTLLKDVDGQVIPGNFCPSDPVFVAMQAKAVASFAALGPDIIMFDDDLRLNCRSMGQCCTCDCHMHRLERELGRSLTREQLKDALAEPLPNPVRTAFLKVNGDIMREFADSMRRAADSVRPEVRLGYCAAPTSFDSEGYSAEELAFRFAGEHTRPFLRLSGAPYWAQWEMKRLAETVEFSRLELSWIRSETDAGKTAEIFSEGDVYPRPRVYCPAAYLECFDQALYADRETDGILKYMLDYSKTPRYEHGYIDRHVRDSAIREWIGRELRTRKSSGVYNYVCHRIVNAQHRPYDRDAVSWADPASTRFLLAQSLPVTYEEPDWNAENEPPVIAFFGENARFFDQNKLDSPAGRAAAYILDGEAARILADRGYDAGFAGVCDAEAEQVQISCDSGERVTVSDIAGSFLRFTLRPEAKILIRTESGCPALYSYTDVQGRTFIVNSFIARPGLPDRGILYYDYERQRLIRRAIRESGARLSGAVNGFPGLYLQTFEGADGSMAAGLWNLYPDAVIDPVLVTGKTYGAARVFSGALAAGQKHWHEPEFDAEPEGETLRLGADIEPYGFAGVILRP